MARKSGMELSERGGSCHRHSAKWWLIGLFIYGGGGGGGGEQERKKVINILNV